MKRILLVLCVLLGGDCLWAQPAEIVPNVPLRVYNCSLGGRTPRVQRGSQYELYINVENYGSTAVRDVEFMIVVPEGITIIKNDHIHVLERVQPRSTQCVNYAIAIGTKYERTEVPIVIWIGNNQGALTECYEAVITLGAPVVDPISVSRVQEHNTKVKQRKVLPETVAETDVVPVIPVVAPVVVGQQNQKAEDQTSPMQLYVVEGSNVNVRSAPNTTRSQVEGRLRNGEIVEGRSVSSSWVNVMYKGKSSYVSAAYLKKVDKEKVEDESGMEEDVKKTVVEESEPVEEVVTEEKKEPSRVTQSSVYQTPSQVYEPSRQSEKVENSRMSEPGYTPTGQTVSSSKESDVKAYILMHYGYTIVQDHVWGLDGGIGFGPAFVDNILLVTGFDWHFTSCTKSEYGIEGNTIRIPIMAGLKTKDGGVSVTGGFAWNYQVNSKFKGEWADMSKVDNRTSWTAMIRANLLFFYYQCDISLKGKNETIHTIGLYLPLQ